MRYHLLLATIALVIAGACEKPSERFGPIDRPYEGPQPDTSIAEPGTLIVWPCEPDTFIFPGEEDKAVSYDIYIGNAEIRYESSPDNDFVDVHVPRVERKEAPTFPDDETTGCGNSRHPGYTQWADFLREAGLHDLFFLPGRGLMRNHPGTQPIRREHLRQVRTALANRRKIATLPPGFHDYGHEGEDQYDAVLACLIWLEYWMSWALETCDRPAIHNH